MASSPAYLVVFASGPVDDALADAIVARVRAFPAAGWFDDPGAATPDERTTGGYVRVPEPDAPDGRALLELARELSAARGVVFEVQWREQVVGHLDGGAWRPTSPPSSS